VLGIRQLVGHKITQWQSIQRRHHQRIHLHFKLHRIRRHGQSICDSVREFSRSNSRPVSVSQQYFQRHECHARVECEERDLLHSHRRLVARAINDRFPIDGGSQNDDDVWANLYWSWG
jgi:hypothetical protein